MLSESKNSAPAQGTERRYPVTVIDLRQTAREFLDQAKGDLPLAADLLIRAAHADQTLWRALTEQALERRVRDLCSEIAKTDRGILRNGGTPPQPDETRANARAEQYASYKRGKFLDSYRLAVEGRPALGDATKAQLVESAKRVGIQGRTMLREEQFQLFVAKLVKDPSKPIGEQLKEADVEKCYERANE